MPRTSAGNAGAALRVLALAALIVGLAAAGPEKRSTITNVSLQEIGGTTQLSFNADGAVKCEYVMSPDPTLVIVDVKGASHTLPRTAALTSQAVKGLTTDLWHTEDGTPVTRITVALTAFAHNWIEPQANGFTVMIEPLAPGETISPALASAYAASAESTNAPASVATTTPSTTTAPASAAATTAPSTTPAGPASPTTEQKTAGASETWGSVTVESPVPSHAAATAATAPAVAPANLDAGTGAPSDNTTAVRGTGAGQASAPDQTEAAGSDDEAPLSPAQEMLMSRPLTFEPKSLESGQRYAGGGAHVSLDIQGADIRTVMRSLAEYSGTNIVVGKEVQGSVTVNLTEVPWLDALNTICRTQALGWVEEEGIIRVETLENLRKEDVARSTADRQMEDLQPLTTQIVRAVYATATELKPAIEKTLTQRGHVEADPRTNSLIITDVSRRVSAAVEMVNHLDSRTPQIEIIAKLVDLDARFTRDLGINWTLGGLHSTDQAASGDVHVNSGNVIDPAGTVRFGLVRSWGTINAMLSALEQDNKADIISNPSITTVNNREARILVGRKIPLIVLDEAGNAVTQLTTIGITLRVTPHINDDERITLDLHPEVSDLASQATVQGGIIINTSEADTRVIVDDGETAVIGGLIRSNTEKLRRGVPILSSIPIIKYAFSGVSEVKEKRELLIFITPKIITNWAQTQKKEG